MTNTNPITPRVGRKTPSQASLNDGHPQVTTILPEWLKNKLPDRDAILDAILDAPHIDELPEPPRPWKINYCIRFNRPGTYQAFEEKRDGHARGTCLRRILYWKWG